MPHDVGKDPNDVVVGAAQLAMIDVQRAGDAPLVQALVEFRIIEGDRERPWGEALARAASVVISDESRPPLSSAPTGTSARRRSRVAAVRRASSSSIQSLSGRESSAGVNVGCQCVVSMHWPSRHSSEWPGGSSRDVAKHRSRWQRRPER